MAEKLEINTIDYIDDLYSYAVALTRNLEDAEDLVQETYVRALLALNRLTSDSNVKAWLCTILRNVWLNQVRQRNRRPRMVELDANNGADYLAAERSGDPLGQYARKSDEERVRRAILRLPTEFREILVLREYEELSYCEIARLLACPAGTVMSRLARARERLRWLLECEARPETPLERAPSDSRSSSH